MKRASTEKEKRTKQWRVSLRHLWSWVEREQTIKQRVTLRKRNEQEKEGRRQQQHDDVPEKQLCDAMIA